jgi:5-methyltetrahydrofolate--homocysteine methyltransferase
MTNSAGFPIQIIGERISPGYKSTKALLDASDLGGIQALALKQVEAGAAYLDVHLGTRGARDLPFVGALIRSLQEVVDVPLCFDFPEIPVLEAAFEAYDAGKARGALPLLNSLTDQRWELMQLYKRHPFRVIVMASERIVDGTARSNKTAQDIAATAQHAALRLQGEYGVAMPDIFIDIAVRAVIVDTAGLNRATLDAIGMIRNDARLPGIHIMGALTNIGQQMPAQAADGSNLKHSLENAFLTLAVPNGLDTVMGTPWIGYRPLAQDHYVMKVYREFLGQTGSNALRTVRKFYRAA